MRAAIRYRAGNVRVETVAGPKSAARSAASARGSTKTHPSVSAAGSGATSPSPAAPAPARAYTEELLPEVLDGRLQPGKVFDRTVDLDGAPAGYEAMDERQALKVLVLTTALLTLHNEEHVMHKNPTTATVQTPASNFSGAVWMNPVFGGDGTSQLTCGYVRFTPGARTNWHSHVNGQLLVCTDGIGLVGTRDGTTVALCAGESVWTPAGEEHFHDGTAQNMMCHYAILDAAGDGEATTWLEPVTDEQYSAAHTTAGV